MSGTNVKISGFKLNFSNEITINEFFQELVSISKNADSEFTGYTTRVYTRVINNLIVGLVLTFKNEKTKLASVSVPNGKLKVNRVELEKHQTSTEASLFCFNPNSLTGIYTHYTGSASVSIYNNIFKLADTNVKKRLTEERINSLTESKTRGNIVSAKKEAKNTYSGSFSITHIYQTKDLDQILSELESLSELEVTTELGIPDEPLFRSLSSVTKKTTQTINFLDKFRPIELLKTYLSDFVRVIDSKKDKKYALKLMGKAIGGEQANFLLGNNIEEFGSFRYDEYIDNLPIDVWDNYTDCKALSLIIDIVQKDSETFGDIKNACTWNKHSDSNTFIEISQSAHNAPALNINDKEQDPLQFEMCLPK
jgi:hypothetical protein